MPVVYLNGFKTSVRAVWEWDDTDDAGLVAFVTDGRTATCNDFTVDRSDSPVRLQWQKYQYWDGGYVAMGEYDSIPIVVGDHIDPRCPYPYPTPAGPGVRDSSLGPELRRQQPVPPAQPATGGNDAANDWRLAGRDRSVSATSCFRPS